MLSDKQIQQVYVTQDFGVHEVHRSRIKIRSLLELQVLVESGITVLLEVQLRLNVLLVNSVLRSNLQLMKEIVQQDIIVFHKQQLLLRLIWQHKVVMYVLQVITVQLEVLLLSHVLLEHIDQLLEEHH